MIYTDRTEAFGARKTERTRPHEASKAAPYHLGVAIGVVAFCLVSSLRQRLRQPRHELGFQHACGVDPALGKLCSEERDRQRGRLVELGRHGSLE